MCISTCDVKVGKNEIKAVLHAAKQPKYAQSNFTTFKINSQICEETLTELSQSLHLQKDLLYWSLFVKLVRDSRIELMKMDKYLV